MTDFTLIYIITFSPKYQEYENKERPKWTWEKKNGDWIGIWGYDWGDLIGKSLASVCKNINIEIWQFDLRADIIYSAELADRVIHRNFPAKMVKSLYGSLISGQGSYLYSKEMIDFSQSYNHEGNVLFHPATIHNPGKSELFKSISKLKIIHTHFLNDALLLPSFDFSFNPKVLLQNAVKYFAKKNNLHQMNYLISTNNNPKARKLISEKYENINIYDFTIGIDLTFWDQEIAEEKARALLNLSGNLFVFLLSQRLVPEYQIEKFIETVSKISSKNHIYV
jgi:hypothetical protein